jgi:hypothetical protein
MSMDTTADATAALRALTIDLVRSWIVDGVLPEHSMEAVHPRLSAMLGGSPAFSFDDLRGGGHGPGWAVREVRDDDVLASPIELRVPDDWQLTSSERFVTEVVDAAGRRRQVLQIVGPHLYPEFVREALSADLLGFDFSRGHSGDYQWRFVSETPDSIEIRGLFGGRELGVVTLLDAASADELRTQLISSLASIPAIHWASG